AIGRPYMPPYWSLGFHLCKYGYNNIDNLKDAVERTKAAGIPQDVQYADIDAFNGSMDFTVDHKNFPGLNDYFNSLRNDGMRIVVMLDPFFVTNVSDYEPYDRLKAISGAVKWPAIDPTVPDDSRDSDGAVLGYVWPKGKVVFPDFFNNDTRKLWRELIVKHRNETLTFDGLWIDMNEPANFGTNEDRPWNWPKSAKPYWSLKCPKNKWDDPPFRPIYLHDSPDNKRRARLSDNTLCMMAKQGKNGEYRHYDVHNLYGWSQTPGTLEALRGATGERSMLLTRSSFPGSGKYAGHWLGDNDAEWRHLKHSIIGMLEFNLFGIPYIGSDICGFFGNSSAELCMRWMQLGAFYSFSRNHNGIDFIPQDPGAFGPDVAEASRIAMVTRYRLLPYLYTLFYKAHVEGSTVIRPLHHEFYTDPVTYGIDEQFLWGPALLISPILREGQNDLTYYIPSGQWFDFYNGSAMNGLVNVSENVDLNSKIQLNVRGGYIIPMQEPANNTHYSRRNPLMLLVALNSTDTQGGYAEGELFWDDGVSIDTYETGHYFLAKFKAEGNILTMVVEHSYYPATENLVIDTIEIRGIDSRVQEVVLDSPTVDYPKFTHESEILNLTGLAIPLYKPFRLEWRSSSPDSAGRIDCFPEAIGGLEKVTFDKCHKRGCKYMAAESPIPSCFFKPHSSYGYSVNGPREDTDFGFRVNLTWTGATAPYGTPLSLITFEVQKRDNNVLRFKIFDPNEERFEVPIALDLPETRAPDPDMMLCMRTLGCSASSYDSSVGGLTFSDQFLQIATRLASRHVYGFGENVHPTFRHDLWYKTWPMFARDQWASDGTENHNHYGVHPFYMVMEEDGLSHGVLLLNSNAQDYSFTPLPMLIHRTIGGILDFYVFMGPEPENVVQEYTKVIGRPYMPPYWALGFQMSRYGYNNIINLRGAVDRTKRADIPHDVQYADIDHMDERKDFTIDPINFPNLKQYFEELRAGGMRTIIILDPCLITNVSGYRPYEALSGVDGAIHWPVNYNVPANSKDDNNAVLGFVWPKGKVVFPDFFKEATKTVWKNLTVEHYQRIPFDGIWISLILTQEQQRFSCQDIWTASTGIPSFKDFVLSRPETRDPHIRAASSFVYDELATSGSEGRKAQITDKTICLVARQGDMNKYRHYDVHSLYGWSQNQPTLDGLRTATGERGIVITRSTFPGSGKTGGHWLGDNFSQWSHLQRSIIGMLEFNLFGIPYIGADICGFFGETTEELCARWMQLGTFNPFYRNHNGIGNRDQDPANFGADVTEISRSAVTLRYLLLPYLYTLFHQAHVRGHTVVRPLHHEFPRDRQTYSIDRQFMWGPAFLVSPVLEEGQNMVTAYLPSSTWYNYHTAEKISGGKFITMDVLPISAVMEEGPDKDRVQTPIHVRGGYIIPLQQPANNTHYSRRNDFSLLVTLERDNKNAFAEGELFWDDGVSIDTYENGNYFLAKFRASDSFVDMKIQHNINVREALHNINISRITVYGIQSRPNYVYLNNTLIASSSGQTAETGYGFVYKKDNQVSKISGPHSLQQDFLIEWYTVKRPEPEDAARIDCIPDLNSHTISKALKDECNRRRCLWLPVSDTDVPPCFLSRDEYGYRMTKHTETSQGHRVDLSWKNTSQMFHDDIQYLQLELFKLSNSVLRFKFSDPSNERYEVPVPLKVDLGGSVTSPLYSYSYGNNLNGTFYLKVTRNDTGVAIFDSSIGGLTFADQFLQIATKLASEDVYGLGENRHFSFRHNFNYKTWPMFARDQGVNWGDYGNLYGYHPFYMNVEDDVGNAHGVFLLNSNAMEVVLQPAPSLMYRTVGGVLDFYLFLGPGPEAVIQQYTEVIGHPYLPPYWSLGFQLCKYGYNNLATLKEAVNRTIQAGIPFDVQYADIDHMNERMDFTIDDENFSGLSEFVTEIKDQGMHFIIIIDPALISNVSGYEPYEIGLQKDVFIKWQKNTSRQWDTYKNDNMLGYVWPKGKVVFPDFFKPATRDYWAQLISDHHQRINFDGLWIDMNEPANFGTNEERPFNWPEDAKPYWSLKCINNKWDDPPYKPKSIYGPRLSDKTLCMSAVQNDSQLLHYNVHNLYGWSQTEPTLHGLRDATEKRGMVISRSTYPSSGKSAGHWLGDNDSQWSNLHDSVIGILEFNLFGIPYVGADICGFFGNSDEELCQRWMQLGAFYTFSRNHNTIGAQPQDPAYFGSRVADSSRRALLIRYHLLPYLYTLFYNAHTKGGTVIRSMMHEFPADKACRAIDTQFLWGSAFMIAPVLHSGRREINVYFPDARWYDYHTGEEVTTRKQIATVNAPIDTIPLFVRGGHILPVQEPANTTVYSRQNAMGLIIALDENSKAEGTLFWDDGDSIDSIGAFQCFLFLICESHNGIIINLCHLIFQLEITSIPQTNYGPNLELNYITILGVNKIPTRVYLSAFSVVPIPDYPFKYHEHVKMLVIEDIHLQMTKEWLIYVAVQ
ncbi:hypothetical protein ScPMuIL_005317, partial [Solemya velum]